MANDGQDFVVSDELVGLRHFTLDDVDGITAACQDREIIRWTTIPSPYTVEFATAFVTLQDGWRAEGSAFHFAIVDRRDGGLSGSIGLDSIQQPPAQVGYWVAPWARRRGFATHALRLVTTWAFKSLRLDAISLVTKVGNNASERVAANSGYVFSEEVTDDVPANVAERFTVRRWVRDDAQLPAPEDGFTARANRLIERDRETLDRLAK
jgi:RimJ/RimL family protein N-acetyltransferase